MVERLAGAAAKAEAAAQEVVVAAVRVAAARVAVLESARALAAVEEGPHPNTTQREEAAAALPLDVARPREARVCRRGARAVAEVADAQ